MPSERSVMISFIAFTPVPRLMSSQLGFDAARLPGDIVRSVAIVAMKPGHVACRQTRWHRTHISRLVRAFGPPKAQCVAHSFLLGPQVGKRVRIRRSLAAEQDDH